MIRRLLPIAVLVLAGAPSRAGGDRLDWRAGFGSNGPSSDVFTRATFDAGTGPTLCLGGTFATAGDVSGLYPARSNGSE